MRGLFAMLLVFSLPVLAADPHMTKEERANALPWLEQSRAEFLAAVDGVTEAQWKWKPAPDRWSVGRKASGVVPGGCSSAPRKLERVAVKSTSASRQ